MPIPDDVNVKIQICKFAGHFCTPYLLDTDLNMCGILRGGEANGDADDEYYCAAAGTYNYQTEFTLPEHALSNTNFAVNGVTFRIYVLLNNEITCNAQFTTAKSDSYASTGYSMLGAVVLAMSGFSANEIRKRRRRTLAQVDLNAEEQHQQYKNERTKRVQFEDHYVNL